jgi:hypothetical protein
MSSRLRLSIALCTYNGQEYLPAQLDSFLNQTRLPDELVVGDDRSNDATPQILEEFARKAPFPVRVHYNQANLGVYPNFSATIGRADGDVIFYSDQDDFWRPEKLARVERLFLEQPDTGLVMVDADVGDQSLNPLGYALWESLGLTTDKQDRLESPDGFNETFLTVCAYGATMAVRGDLRPYFLPVPPNDGFDRWTGWVVSAMAPVRLIRERLQIYRQHPKQLVGGKKVPLVKRAVQLWRRNDSTVLLRLADDLEELRAALARAPTNPRLVKSRQQLDVRLQFLRDRVRMRQSPIARAWLVMRHLSRGTYWRYAQGLRSAGLDLTAPFA